MQYGYLIKISNKNIYREVQLPVDAEVMKIGMGIDCDVRFYKESFFEDFELTLKKINSEWQISCSDNIYIDAGDVRKLVTKKLSHGESFKIKYQGSESELFRFEFLFDFDNENKDYDRIINVSTQNGFTIGSNSNCHIVINSEYVKNDLIEFKRINNDLKVNIKSTTYGFYINGRLVKNGEVIKNTDFFSIANFSFYYKNGNLRTSKSVNVNGLNYADEGTKNNYPRFNRNTRIKTVLSDEKIEVLDPPAKPQKPKNNIVSRLLPSAVMIVAGIAMAGISPFMLISSGVGVITAIISVIQSKKDFKDNSAERIEKYTTYIENKKNDIAKERENEKTLLEEIYINSDKECQYFAEFSCDLFDRVKADEDFLTVRLGIGDVKAKKEINFKKQEKLEVEDDLQTKPEEISKEFKYVHSAPITCSFKNSNAVGIVGNEQYRYEMMKNIIIDICARQFQNDVKLFFVAEKTNKEKIHWLRMLPHVYNDAIGIRNIVCDDESKNVLFEYLYKELTIREQNKKYDNNIVMFLYDEYGFQNHPISKFIEKGKDLGITFVFFADNKANIGLGCKYIIDIVDEKNAKLIDTEDRSKLSEFTYSTISDMQAKSIANLLAPVYTEEISLEGTLTKNISLFKLLNILAVDDIDLTRNWNTSQVFKSMAAPLGVSKSGIVELDLHDKAHGPHGLVAGTTGSGKSEILQTYILSMATLYHPYEVAFVIIDFKGGGMVNQFKNLPHLVGAITNIDGKEIDRSLKSIKAELKKRQRLFAEAEVNHIDKYIKKFKVGEVSEPLPHLILIVDEFAELKADQPEFMKELISAARIGRSLGVHLILATQKPSGQVDDQIWSNSRFKLCLKVQDQSDSNEVLKSPLAAEIKEPGRAYLQVGNNEIFELFQSAYSGAPEKADNSNVKEFTVYSLTDSGRKVAVYQQKKKKMNSETMTQLDAIVKYVDDYAQKNNIAKLPDICLPPLAECFDYDKNVVIDELSVPIGIFDDPDNQLQSHIGINIFAENTLIIGSSMSGKTNLLQLIIRGIAHNYSPSEISIYIIDFASMVLKNFEALNHVGGVVVSNEDEKLKNLFKLILEQITLRKEKMLAAGVSNYLSYKESGKADFPQIVLMIDNLTALNELYLQDDDTLLTICREGIAVGISVIIANSQTQGIGYKYISNFSSKIALYCNDSNEYSSIFDYCRMQIPATPGRCIIEKDKQHYECQTYLAFDGEKEFERVVNIRELIKVINTDNKSCRAMQIPCIPRILKKDMLEADFNGNVVGYNIPIGLTYADVKPFYLDLYQLGIIGVCGKDGFGHKNFIANIIDSVNSNSHKTANVVIFDDISRKFSEFKNKVSEYSLSAETVADIVRKWHKELEQRYNKMLFNETVDDKSELLLMIIQNNDVATSIQQDMEISDMFNDIITRYKNLGVCIIFSNYPNSSISYDAPDAIRSIKQNQHIICLDELQNLKCFDPPYEAIRMNRKPLSLGDGYYINDNEVTKIKLVLSE